MREYIGNEFTYLLPGELIVTSKPLKITTTLGSCVSVCLFDQERGIAAMNHYMLPRYNNEKDKNIFRYGDSSLEYMLEKMIRTGAIKEKIVARVFGGSSMFINPASNLNVGAQNIEIALNFLKNNRIRINATEIGGESGRKVVFDTSAGVISCNLLISSIK